MNEHIHPHELRVAWHNLTYHLDCAIANSNEAGVAALFDELVQDRAYLDELEQALQRNTDLRLVDRLDFKSLEE